MIGADLGYKKSTCFLEEATSDLISCLVYQHHLGADIAFNAHEVADAVDSA